MPLEVCWYFLDHDINKHCTFFVFLSVQSANLKDTNSSFFSGKGDPYVEMVVDSQPPRKTEVVKKTWNPKWDEHFTV